MYALSCNFSPVIPMFLQFYRCSFMHQQNQAIIQLKNKIVLVTWVSEHHAILQWKSNIMLVKRVSEHHVMLQ